MLRRHNLQWEMPTKTFPTQRAIAWLKKLVLPEIDRLEMDYLLADLEHVQQRRAGTGESDRRPLRRQRAMRGSCCRRCRASPCVTATALACRVGQVERFPRSHSLANYWGLTPGCRNSGENSQRLGSITKAGSSMARWLLAQVTHQVLRKDARLREWFKRIKRRRGSSIARVAVMRKLATIIWHMLTKQGRMPSAGRSRPAEQEVAGTSVTSPRKRKTAKETRASRIRQVVRSEVPDGSSRSLPFRPTRM